MMKSVFVHFLNLCTAALAITSHTKLPQQKSLFNVDIMAKKEKVPGHSDAVYGSVPKEDQLLDVEFLDIAPTPIISYAVSSIEF